MPEIKIFPYGEYITSANCEVGPIRIKDIDGCTIEIGTFDGTNILWYGADDGMYQAMNEAKKPK